MDVARPEVAREVRDDEDVCGGDVEVGRQSAGQVPTEDGFFVSTRHVECQLRFPCQRGVVG